MNCQTIRKMVRSVNETYLNILSPIPKCDFGTNEVSALSNSYLHSLRFIGTRLDCNNLTRLWSSTTFFLNYSNLHANVYRMISLVKVLSTYFKFVNNHIVLSHLEIS